MNLDLQAEITLLKQLEISKERQAILAPLISYLQTQTAAKQPIRLNFICTHNSRRSHLAQVWAAVAADYYRVPQVSHYSGGTETTAIYPAVVTTLQKQGISHVLLSAGENPIYAFKYALGQRPLIGFSKPYDHPFNPTKQFAAVMTCSHADENCPFIPGVNGRFALDYEDPKAFDESPMMAQKYLERSRQIGAEMFYVFSKIMMDD